MSNRLFRSERHRALALTSPPDTVPAYRISHEPERFCCDGKCTRSVAKVESNCPRWPAGPTLLDRISRVARKVRRNVVGWLFFIGIAGAIAVVAFSSRVPQ